MLRAGPSASLVPPLAPRLIISCYHFPPSSLRGGEGGGLYPSWDRDQAVARKILEVGCCCRGRQQRQQSPAADGAHACPPLEPFRWMAAHGFWLD